MKSNNSTTFIIVTGVVVLVVFTFVATINLLRSNAMSDSYYVKVEDNMSAKIEALNIYKGKLIITTSGDTIEYCVKSTKSTPTDNAMCWKDINDNKASISVFENEKYYIWIKDTNRNISSPMSINTDESDRK